MDVMSFLLDKILRCSRQVIEDVIAHCDEERVATKRKKA
jgi:hypothetical protein